MRKKLMLPAWLWPRQGGVRAVLPIFWILAVPLLFAAVLIATTNVEWKRYFEVVKLLGMVAVSFGTFFAVAGLIVQRLRKGRGESALVSTIWYLGGALLAGLTIPTFGIFKQLILPAQGFPWDPNFAAWDKALFFGTDPWRVTHAWLGSVQATKAIDFCYSRVWMIIMYSFPVITVACFDDIAMRVRIFGSWLASWIFIGGAGAWLFASAGPVYYSHLVGPHASFDELNMRLKTIAFAARHQAMPILAIEFQPMLLKAFNSGRYAPAGGISAMPSMHIAMATLFALVAFRLSRLLGCIMTLFALIIWVGSVHLGWHYALDGIVAALMMVAIWRLAFAIHLR